jgi:hypothetical protein
MPKSCQSDPNCNPPGGGQPGEGPWYCFRGLCATYQCADISDCAPGQNCNSQTNLCYEVAKGCTIAAQCSDADPCTADTCDKATGKCKHVLAGGCCNTAADCTVAGKCTQATCKAGKCEYGSVPGCCQENAECYDGQACTEDLCKSGACVYPKRADCCTGSGGCDDGVPASVDLCHGGKCLHQWPGTAKTCKTAADCTSNACIKGSCHEGACGYNATGAGGCCDAEATCKTLKKCTVGQCVARVCKLIAQTPTGVHATSNFDTGGLSVWKVYKGNKIAYFHFSNIDKVAGPGCVRYGVPGKIDIGPGNNNSGTLTSPKFTLPTKLPAVRFEVFFDGNPISSVQVFGLEVVSAGKAVEVWNKTKDLGGSTQQLWKTQKVDLAAWAGKLVQLRFYFDVKFATNKEKKKGLLIDELKILGACP